jgi:hypothetical protein
MLFRWPAKTTVVIISTKSPVTAILEDITCLFMSFYFNGTFQNPQDTTQTFDAQFQIKIGIDEEKTILKIVYWNESLSSSDNIFTQLWAQNSWTK